MLKIFLSLLLLNISAMGYDMNMRGTDDILKRMHKKSSKVGQREDGKLKAIGARKVTHKPEVKASTQTKEIKKVTVPPEKKVATPKNGLIWENGSIQYITTAVYDSVLKEFIELKYPQVVQEYNLEIKKQKAIAEKIRLQKEQKAKARLKKQKEQRARAQKAKEEKEKAQKLKEVEADKAIKKEEIKVRTSKKPKKMKREEEFVIGPNKQMWQDNEDTKTTNLSWTDAIGFCENLKIESYDDWRLPNKEELDSIVDKNQKPTINKAFGNVKATTYWSKSDYRNSQYYAWVIDFSKGESEGYSKVEESLVRCVRDGE